MMANIHSLVFMIFKILLLKSAVKLEAATSVNQTQKVTTTPSTGPATISVTRPSPSYIYPGISSLNEQSSALDAPKATYSSDNTAFANKYSSPATVLQSSPSTQRLQKTDMRRSSELVVTQASSSSSNQRLTKSAMPAEYKGMNTTILQKSKPHQVTTFAVSSVYTKTQATKSSSESAETKKGAINPSSLPTFLSTVSASSLPRATRKYGSTPSNAEAIFPTNTPVETELPYSTKAIVELQAESSSVLSTSSSLDNQKQNDNSPSMPVTEEGKANTTFFAYYVSPSEASTILRSPFNETTAETKNHYAKEGKQDTSSFHSTFSGSFLYKTKLIEKSSFISSTSDSEAKTTVFGNVLPSVTVTSVVSHSIQKTVDVKLIHSAPKINDSDTIHGAYPFSSIDMKNVAKSSFTKTKVIQESSYTIASNKNVFPSLTATNLTSQYVQEASKAEMLYPSNEIKVSTSFLSTYSASSLLKTEKKDESSSTPTETKENDEDMTIFPSYVLPSVVTTNLTSQSVQKTPKAEVPTSFLPTYSASSHLKTEKKDESSSIPTETKESDEDKTIVPSYIFPSVVATKTPTAEALYSTKEIKVSTSFLSTYSVSLLQQTEHINESSSIPVTRESDVNKTIFPNIQSIQETPAAEAPYSTKEIEVSTSFSSTYFAPSLQKTEQINESSSVSATIGESNANKTIFPEDLPRVVATNLNSQSIQKTPKAEISYSTKEIKVTTTFLPTYSVSSVEQTKQIDKSPSIAASRTNMTVPPNNLSTLITTNRSSAFIQKTAVSEKPYSSISLLTNSTFSLHKAKQTGETSSFPVSREITEYFTVLVSALPSMDVATSTLPHFIHMTPTVKTLSSSKELKASGTFNSTHSVDSLRLNDSFKTKEIKTLSSVIVTHERKTNRTEFPNVLPTTVARNKSSRSEIPQSTIEEIKESRTSIPTYSSSSSQQPKELEESSILLSRSSITNMTEFPNVLPSVVATNTIIEASYTSKKIKESTIFLSPYSVSSLSKAKQIEESRSIPAPEEIGKANMTVSATVVPEVVATSTIPRSVQTKTETPYSTKDIEEATESSHSTYSISTVQKTKDITKLSSIAEKSIVSTTSNVSQSIQKTTEITYATKQIEKSSVFLTASSSSLYKAKDIKESSSIYAQMETKTLTVFASFSPRVFATHTTSHKVKKTAYLKTKVTYSSKEIKTSAMLPLPESTTKFETTQTVVPTTPDDTKIIVQEFRMIFKITSGLFTNELSRHTSKEFKEKSHEIEQKFNDIYKNMPEYSYSKVLRFFEGSLGCEVAIFLESKDTNPVQEQTVKDVLLREKGNGVFGDFVDLDVKEVKPEEKETNTWGRWPVVVVSILGGICLVLLVVVITQCIQKRHYSHSIAEYSGFPDTPLTQLKVSKNHDYSDEERIPMNTFHPDISLV